MRKYDRITHQGKRLDRYTLALIEAAERRLGRTLVITQGGYNGGAVKASAGTHDGGGAFDVSTRGMTENEKRATVRALRLEGGWAWLRTPDQGPWVEHIHVVQAGNAKRSAGARRQASAGRRGRNGLANNGPDDGPPVTVPVLSWSRYVAVKRKPTPRPTPTPAPVVVKRRPPNVRKALDAITRAEKHATPARRTKLRNARQWLLKIKKK